MLSPERRDALTQMLRPYPPAVRDAVMFAAESGAYVLVEFWDRCAAVYEPLEPELSALLILLGFVRRARLPDSGPNQPCWVYDGEKMARIVGTAVQASADDGTVIVALDSPRLVTDPRAKR